MAKRKRLEVPDEALTGSLETKSAFPGMSRMPIAEVAGDTSARAALDEVTQAMASAEAEGRVVRKLALDSIDVDHLNRDRMVLDAEEMATLTASLAERGQQTPIEVLSLPARALWPDLRAPALSCTARDGGCGGAGLRAQAREGRRLLCGNGRGERDPRRIVVL